MYVVCIVSSTCDVTYLCSGPRTHTYIGLNCAYCIVFVKHSSLPYPSPPSSPISLLPPPPSSDFLPIFVWVLLQCECGRAELEAEFMWGLVHPSLLNGEGGYYLTTLTSAVQVVKQLKFGNLALDEGKPANQVCLGSLWTLMHV